jgi:hypothetical protein
MTPVQLVGRQRRQAQGRPLQVSPGGHVPPQRKRIPPQVETVLVVVEEVELVVVELLVLVELLGDELELELELVDVDDDELLPAAH